MRGRLLDYRIQPAVKLRRALFALTVILVKLLENALQCRAQRVKLLLDIAAVVFAFPRVTNLSCFSTFSGSGSIFVRENLALIQVAASVQRLLSPAVEIIKPAVFSAIFSIPYSLFTKSSLPYFPDRKGRLIPVSDIVPVESSKEPSLSDEANCKLYLGRGKRNVGHGVGKPPKWKLESEIHRGVFRSLQCRFKA